MLSTFFLALPLPLKIVAIAVGGLFFTGVRVDQAVREMPAAEDARDEVHIAPAPAQIIPAQAAPGEKAAKPLEIGVNSDGSYQLDGKKVTEVMLTKYLKTIVKTNPGQKIIIKADALTPYQMVTNVVNLSKNMGLTNVSFASKAPAP